MAFDINFQEKATILLHKRKFVLYPKLWEDTTQHISIPLKWKYFKFEDASKDLIASRKGIYCFILKPAVPSFFETSYLLYVGETTRTLKIRFSEYLNDQAGKGKPRLKVFEMLKLYKDYLYFYFAEIDDEKDIHEAEDKLINSFIPFTNTRISLAKINPEYKNIYEA